jgi:hypothetical protein
MNKQKQEEYLINLYKNYFNIREKDITRGFIDRGLFLGAAFGFLYYAGIISNEQFSNLLPWIAFFFIYALHLNVLDKRQFIVVYMEFLEHVKKNRLDKFKIKKFTWFENWVYYTRKN